MQLFEGHVSSNHSIELSSTFQEAQSKESTIKLVPITLDSCREENGYNDIFDSNVCFYLTLFLIYFQN